MKRILSTLTLLLCFAFTAVNAQDNYDATTMGNIVRYYETAKWAQGSPFNNQCWTDATQQTHAKTGCVPTAFAIIMRHHGFPAEGIGNLLNQQTGEQFTDRTYDYNKMPLTGASGWTTEQQNEVAKLMAHLGHAFGVTFGQGTTSVSIGNTMSERMQNFFNYNYAPVSNQYAGSGQMYDFEEWKKNLKNSLDNGCPVPYAADNKKDGTNDTRHMFVIDGYTENEYFHFNFGWGGGSNGWYKLDNITPTGDDYSWRTTSDGYDSKHQAFFNLMPNTTTYAVTATVNDSNMGTVSINNGTAGSTATANLMQGVTATLTAHPAQDYALASWTKNGVVVGSRTTLEVKVGTDANDYVANFDDEANVYVIKDYIISPSTVGLTGSSKESVVNYQTSDEYPAALSLASTTTNGTSLSAMSRISDDQIRLYAYDQATSSTTVKYTLSVPDGYQITEYKFEYSLNSTSYPCTITYSGGTISPNNTTWTSSPVIVNNAQTAEFTISAENAHSSSNFYIRNFTVTVAKISSEGGTGGSTPTPDPDPEPDPTPVTYAITTTANPAAGGTAKFAVGTGSQQTQGDVENGTSITLYATANTGYNFVNWTLDGNVVSTDATCNVNVAQAANYVANFEAVQQGGSSNTNLAGKYFRLKQKNTTNYMNIYDNITHGKESRGGVNVTTKNESNDGQIFQFIESGTNYKLLSKTGYYVTWKEWNVNADSKENGADLTFEPTATELEYLISCTNGYFKIDTDKGTPSLGKFVYSDGAQGAAATWVLEEVVYYTVTATAGEGGSVSPLTSTVEQGKPVTLTATANSGYRFVNWTLNGNVVSTDASYTFNATAAGEYVANFEISTYTISATANPGTAGSVTINGEAVSSKNVNENSTVTLVATPQAGYCFVNWTKGGVEVSTDATYSFTATEITSLVANFEQIVVNVTLTDAQGNTYNVQLSGFTNGVTKETVAAKLKVAYPYITLGTVENVITLNGSNGAYTYTNTVELPFKVSNATYIWHNIYYPANSNDNPNYIAALNEDEVVDMAASKDYAYGDNPTYNTKDGGNSICWAIYNVNNSFEFIFKSRVTNKYIKVESVSSSTTENVKFVENAEDATAFTLLAKETVDLTGVYLAVTGDCDFALVANIDETTGYLCATSSDKDYVTHFDRYNHRGAWVKIVEAPDYFSKIMDMGTMLGYRFGAGDSKCVIAGTNIEEVDNAMQNSGSITLNKLNDYAARMEAAMATENPTWFNVKTSAENGAAYITLENDDPELTSKRVPGGYELTVKATPATGYHFTGWTMNGTAIEGATDELRFTVTEATTIVASFAINTYTVNVTAGENGSVTVTHDVNGEPVDINGETVDFATVIKIEATPNDGYKFIGWYNGEELQHSINPHEFAINHDINYTARFEEEEAGSTTNKYVIKIDAILTDGETAANNATGNVQAIIHGIGLDWPTSAEVDENATVELVAISDHNQSAYLFDGWYKNGVFVSMDSEITVTVTENATYQARFIKGYVVTLASDNRSWGYPNMITYPDGSPVVGAATELKAVVKPNEEVLISINPNDGFRVANWTDKDGVEVAGKNANSFILEITGDNKYTVNLEKDTYTLTVSTEGTMGAVHIGDGTETDVTVNNGETATITATPNSGYKFVNWTLNGVVVSTENPYDVPAITDNVQYVAVFAEADALDAGYYRIAYGFPVAAAAAKSAATRAAGEETITISPATGDVASSVYSSVWNYNVDNNPAGLKIVATDSESNRVTAITASTGNPSKLRFYAGHNFEGTSNKSSAPTTFTLSVNENYVITGYSLKYIVSSASKVTISNEYGYNETPNRTYQTMEKTDISVQSIAFNVSAASSPSSYYAQADVFTVTIQPVGGESEGGGETPEPEPETVRYYMQSGDGTNNALQMTTDGEGVASIFYYDGGKLLSYQKGTYVKEEDTTRGLQAVGVYGDVDIKIVDTNENEEKICTIKAPSYLHAMNGSTYYVDHCGSDNGDAEHNFIIEKVTSLPVTITDAGYATWYAPVAVQLPDGLTAYTITIQGDYAITGDGFKQVPANTGVILAGAAKTHYLTIINEDVTLEYDNVLEGNVAAKILPNGSAYVLSNKGTIGLAFYMANNGQASWSHKAYLPKSPGAQNSAGFRLILPGTTAIEEVETENNIDAIYDLTGRKLEGISGTGIYIINGKKVIVR